MNGLFWGQGHVFHSRRGEIKNQFRYPIFFLHFNIREEASLRDLFRKKYLRVFSLKADDYLDGRGGSLDLGVRAFVRERCDYEAHEVVLQTFPRMFGYVFNPVSFWLFRRAGKLDAVLCEVRNTFGEKHFYWIPSVHGEIAFEEWFAAEKVFHVSPFQPVDGSYRFRFQIDRDRSRIDIQYLGPDKHLRLVTWIDGELSRLSDVGLRTLLWRYGWMTPLVILRIHTQALRLWRRKAKFFSKPTPPVEEVTS